MNFASVYNLAIRFWSNSDSMLFFCFSFYCGVFTLIAYNRIGGVMVSVLATIMGSSPSRVKPEIIKLIFVASLVSIQH
jgi:hypothetical protein